MRTGLVLEGGAMRGMYTAGVLDVFMESGIEFDGVIGVSAGAIFGVNLLSKQKGRALRYCSKFNSDHEYMGIKPLLREGNYFNTEYCYHRVPLELDLFDNETFKASGIPFYAVVTNIKTGEPEYIRIRDLFTQMDVIRASGSMPILSRPVQYGENEYLDGAVTDSIPFEWMSDHGYDRLVVVLTKPDGYQKKPFSKALAKTALRKYPVIAEKMLRRHEMYNKQIETLKKLEAEGKVLVLRPSSPVPAGRTERDPEKIRLSHELGVRDCRERLAEIRSYLGL